MLQGHCRRETAAPPTATAAHYTPAPKPGHYLPLKVGRFLLGRRFRPSRWPLWCYDIQPICGIFLWSAPTLVVPALAGVFRPKAGLRTCQFRPAWPLGAVTRRHRGGDPPTRGKCRNERHAPRPDHGHQVVQDAVGRVLVEHPLVAVLLQIELQALQFHALGIGHIGESELPEVGLARLGTERREL